MEANQDGITGFNCYKVPPGTSLFIFNYYYYPVVSLCRILLYLLAGIGGQAGIPFCIPIPFSSLKSGFGI